MFKGPDQDVESVFTAPVSAICGVTLDTSGKKEYLISGQALSHTHADTQESRHTHTHTHKGEQTHTHTHKGEQTGRHTPSSERS